MENPRETTHIATQLWKVGKYAFLETMPRIGTSDDRPIYFAYADNALVRSSSFDTIEEAMRYVSRPTGNENV